MLAPPGERHFGRECVAGSFQLDLLDVAGRAGDEEARIRQASAELARHVDDVASLHAAGNPRGARPRGGARSRAARLQRNGTAQAGERIRRPLTGTPLAGDRVVCHSPFVCDKISPWRGRGFALVTAAEACMRLGFGEILVVLALALLFFGPSKLPQLGASLGQAIKGFKKGVSEVEEPESEKKLPPAQP